MTDDDEQAATVMAALAGGAMSKCPTCNVNTLSSVVFRDDSEHPDQRFRCTTCNIAWEIFMPENQLKLTSDYSRRGMVPFDDEGNQQKWEWGAATRYRPNFAFEDTLIWYDNERTRSNYNFQFMRKSTGKLVATLGVDFKIFLPLLVLGEVKGQFTFRKRGCSVGVTFFKERKPRKPRKSRARVKPQP